MASWVRNRARLLQQVPWGGVLIEMITFLKRRGHEKKEILR
jgi:hypothetical protein